MFVYGPQDDESWGGELAKECKQRAQALNHKGHKGKALNSTPIEAESLKCTPIWDGLGYARLKPTPIWDGVGRGEGDLDRVIW